MKLGSRSAIQAWEKLSEDRLVVVTQAGAVNEPW
jgi:hypothetical protein